MEKAPDAFRTISEVAEELDLPQHVLRFWESRFSQIRPMKRGGGRRYYRPDDVDLLRGVRHLLYGEGYTIRGVQRILKDHGIKFVQTVWQAGAPQPAKAPGEAAEAESGSGGRRLFGLLPSLDGVEEGEDESPSLRREPPIEDVTEGGAAELGHLPSGEPAGLPAELPAMPLQSRPVSAAPARQEQSVPAPAAGLAGEDLRKLQATLAELSECRRLLETALADGA